LGPPDHLTPLNTCDGDCDGDNDCRAGYTCIERQGNSQTDLPYCDQGGTAGLNVDYCTPSTGEICSSCTYQGNNCGEGLKCYVSGDDGDPDLVSADNICPNKSPGDSYCIPERRFIWYFDDPDTLGPPDHLTPLNTCDGDCDGDNDCRAGYTCIERRGNSPDLPYCDQGGTARLDVDYCTPSIKTVTYTTPPIQASSNVLVHGVCVWGDVQDASAETGDSRYRYTPLSAGLNENTQLWAQKSSNTHRLFNYTAGCGKSCCEGGTYLQPNIEQWNTAGVTSTIEVQTYSDEVTICILIEDFIDNRDSFIDVRDGGWDSLLPNDGFTPSSSSFKTFENAYTWFTTRFYCKDFPAARRVLKEEAAATAGAFAAAAEGENMLVAVQEEEEGRRRRRSLQFLDSIPPSPFDISAGVIASTNTASSDNGPAALQTAAAGRPSQSFGFAAATVAIAVGLVGAVAVVVA